ncbi:MAG: FAD-binding protein [Candidatus Korobacteraceae bacterium]|jgi:succinate dehydrogenase/fumarate reductase flavoprotein subunit
MTTLEALGQVITTDVLVIGHGAAGLATAIMAKESDPKLKVFGVDKASLGYGGKGNKGGGHCAFIPEGAEEKFVEYHTRNLGDYLNDQDLIRDYAFSTRAVLSDIERWGVPLHGKEAPFNAHPMIPWKVVTVDLDCLIKLAAKARKIGVEFMDKIAVVDLLTDGNRVVGAIGFSILNGATYIFKAKAVVLANGNQNWRIMKMWSPGRGDGIAAAYRAGAKMRNAEFGSFISMVSTEHQHVGYGSEDHLYNAKGTSLTEFARPFMKDNPSLGVLGGADLGGNHALFMYWEVQKGNGPLYENKAENGFVFSYPGRNLAPEVGRADDIWYRPVAEKFWHRLYEKKQLAYQTDSPMKETIPGLIGEFGPVYVDLSMATSLPGLFAAGDICACGGSYNGAVPAPPGRNRGTGLVHAWFTARLAGASAARFAGSAGEAMIDDGQATKLKAEMFAPLDLEFGMTPDEMVWRIQNVMQPIKYSAWKNEERLHEALDIVMKLKAKMPTVVAKDYHYLCSVNECRSMLLASEMFYRACLARKESRGWFIREDYPNRDDKNMLKWVLLQQEGNEMAVSYEDVPMARYKYQPEGFVENAKTEAASSQG